MKINEVVLTEWSWKDLLPQRLDVVGKPMPAKDSYGREDVKTIELPIGSFPGKLNASKKSKKNDKKLNAVKEDAKKTNMVSPEGELRAILSQYVDTYIAKGWRIATRKDIHLKFTEDTPWEYITRKIKPVVQHNKYQKVAEKLHAVLLRKEEENGGHFRHALGWYVAKLAGGHRDVDHKVLHKYYLDNFDPVITNSN